MTAADWRDRVLHWVEFVVVHGLLLLLVIMVLLGTGSLFYLFLKNGGARLAELNDVTTVQTAMQRGFGGVLAVMLGLELLETIRRYNADHHVRVEIVFFVGLIAIGRHVIQLDFHTTSAGEMFGIAGVILALAGGYFLVSRASRGDAPSAG